MVSLVAHVVNSGSEILSDLWVPTPGRSVHLNIPCLQCAVVPLVSTQSCRWRGCVFYRRPNRLWKADLPKVTQSELGMDQRSLWFLCLVHCLPRRSERRWKEMWCLSFLTFLKQLGSGQVVLTETPQTIVAKAIGNLFLAQIKRTLVVDRDDKVLPQSYQRTRLLLSSCSAPCGFHY